MLLPGHYSIIFFLNNSFCRENNSCIPEALQTLPSWALNIINILLVFAIAHKQYKIPDIMFKAADQRINKYDATTAFL